MAQREVETLSPEECFALLGQTSIGRLVYQDEEGPVAVPVNFALAEGDIVIRVEGGIKRAAMSQRTLGLRGGPHR
jgi:nitroimidazol reductase NimA-like FMN-containing flavoprotein (pyridoxamine 5'-phosphate oxidase superfamily)